MSAIEARPDGVVRIHFKHPRGCGAAFSDVSVDTFLARLAALVPPPHFNVTRYYGIFANRHAHRNAALAPEPPAAPPRQLALFDVPRNLALADAERTCVVEPSPRRLAWAKLLSRVFEVDLLVCSLCGGRRRIVEAVTHPDKIAEHLRGARAPPRSPPPGQLHLFGS
jgi:hypothetical protein